MPASFNHVKLRFSTNIPNDPDSHADFQPNNKAVNESGSCSGINIKELVDKVYVADASFFSVISQ